MSTDREGPPDRENAEESAGYIVPLPTSLDQALRMVIPRYVPGASQIRVGWTRDILRGTFLAEVQVSLPDVRSVRVLAVFSELEIRRTPNWFEAAAVRIASKLRDEARNPPPPEGAP